MAAPQSAQPLPNELPNNSVPLGSAEDSQGNPLMVFISHVWRNFFATFAQKTTSIDPAWTQSVSNPPTQSEVQAIVDQVELLSQALGK